MERQTLSTESLIVELDARTAKLDAKLNSTNDKLDKLTDKSEKADSGLRKFGSGAKVAAGVVLKTAAAATALAAAVTAIVVSSAKGRRELELLAKQAKTTTSDFQALSFATNTYGINGEQIADISKDIADKVGEFSAAGTGAFQDYADVMKLTKDEARATAQEFEGLSSQEILGTMVSRMEDASVSGDKMTFVLESLGNDASRLIPLFKGNSKELLELKKRFDDVNSSLQITGTQAEALRDVSNTFTLLTSSAGNATTAISATLAPVLDDFFNDIIAIVPDATQTIINFINSFLDAENISSISGVNKEIEKVNESIKQTTETMIGQVPRMRAGSEAQLASDQLRLKELEAQLVALTDQEKKLEDVNRLSGGQIGGEVADISESGLGTGDEIQAIADRFKLEETLLAEKLVRELQIIGDNNELKLELEKEFEKNIASLRAEEEERKVELKLAELESQSPLDSLREFTMTRAELLDAELINDIERLELAAETFGLKDEELYAKRLELVRKFNEQKLSLEKNSMDSKDKDNKTEVKWSDSAAKSQLDTGTQLLTSLGNNSKAAHKIKQGLAIGNTIMTTAENINEQFPNPIGMTLAGLTGAAQLAAITSSTPDGGGSLSAPPAVPEQAPQQSFNDQGTTITDISDGESISQALVIEFSDEVVDAISRQIQKSQSDGRT
jgi:hypothetical protein